MGSLEPTIKVGECLEYLMNYLMDLLPQTIMYAIVVTGLHA